MKTLFICILLSASVLATAQTSDTQFCKDMACHKVVPEAKAKYSRAVTKENGITTTTVKNLKKDRVEFREVWKGEEPVGVWIGLTGNGPEERDYNFTVVYRKSTCSNTGLPEDLNFAQDNASIEYLAPRVDYKTPDLMSFVVDRLRYPAEARRKGIQGTVDLEFNITAAGKIEDIVITKGVHLLLDKEALRIYRALRFSTPPKHKGQPIAMCAKAHLKFALR